MNMKFSKQDHVLAHDSGGIGAIVYRWEDDKAYVGIYKENDDYYWMPAPRLVKKDEAPEALHQLLHQRGGTCSYGSNCPFWSDWTPEEQAAQLAVEAIANA